MYGIYDNGKLVQVNEDMRALVTNIRANRNTQMLGYMLDTLVETFGSKAGAVDKIIRSTADKPEGFGYATLDDVTTNAILCKMSDDGVELFDGIIIKPFRLSGFYYQEEWLGFTVEEVLESDYKGDVEQEFSDHLMTLCDDMDAREDFIKQFREGRDFDELLNDWLSDIEAPVHRLGDFSKEGLISYTYVEDELGIYLSRPAGLEAKACEMLRDEEDRFKMDWFMEKVFRGNPQWILENVDKDQHRAWLCAYAEYSQTFNYEW